MVFIYIQWGHFGAIQVFNQWCGCTMKKYWIHILEQMILHTKKQCLWLRCNWMDTLSAVQQSYLMMNACSIKYNSPIIYIKWNHKNIVSIASIVRMVLLNYMPSLSNKIFKYYLIWHHDLSSSGNNRFNLKHD